MGAIEVRIMAKCRWEIVCVNWKVTSKMLWGAEIDLYFHVFDR